MFRMTIQTCRTNKRMQVCTLRVPDSQEPPVFWSVADLSHIGPLVARYGADLRVRP